MKISRYAVKHPVVIAMLLVVLVVFGIVSLLSLNVEFMADVSTPSVLVFSLYPGASAEDMEQEVTSVIEDDFVTLPDFKSVESESSNSVSLITITFRDGVDPHERITEVRDRINKLMEELPEGLSGVPNVFVGGVEMLPIFSFAVSAGSDSGTMTKYIQDTLRPRLTSIPGVSSVDVSGGKELQVNIILRLDDLAAKGISSMTVYQILNYSNVTLPAGNVKFNQQNISVRYNGELVSLNDIKELPVGATESGVIIRLQDVADVELSYPKEKTYVTDGKEQVILVDVLKRLDGNTMDIVKQVKTVLKSAQEETGGSFSYKIINDDSRTITASLKTVIMSGISGIIMAVLVIFLFLQDSRATLIIAISIPLSILFTFVAMKLMGVTINLMSLSGMVVALGMVVDGSIVMIEQVYRYYTQGNQEGRAIYSVQDSIFKGSSEVGSSIFASTATTVVVFIPIATLSGIVGMILKDVALTLIMALVSSLISAVIVVPFLMGVFLKQKNKLQSEKKPSFINRGMKKIETKYKALLSWALDSWKFVVFLAICILLATLFITTLLGISFVPSTDNSDFYIDVDFPGYYSLEQTHQGMEQVSDLLTQYVPEVQSVVFFSGSSQGFGSSGNTANSGYAHVVLVPVAERKRDIHDIILLMQQVITANVPDVTVKVSNGGYDKLLGYVSGGGGYGLTLVSEDMDTLYSSATELAEFLRSDSDVVTVEMDTSFDKETLVIDMVHDYMSSLGVTSYEAGVTAAIIFQGMDAGRFRDMETGDRYNIHLFSDITEEEITLDDLTNIHVLSSLGVPVSFSNLASFSTKQEVSQINHIDRAKAITVSANLISEDTSGVTRRVNQWLEKNPLPQGVSSQAGGIGELIGDSLPSLITALCIAFFLVYTVMVLQFERFRQPLIIMATIPFCLIGVVLGLLLFGSTMSLLALLGVISLGGVVVNNGIILVDYINILRKSSSKKEGEETTEDLRKNVIEGSASRLRPIFMTTLTTMLGVVPMAVAAGEGAEIYAPLGQSIAGGLLTSTLITLFIIPALYFVTEKRRLNKRKKILQPIIVFLFATTLFFGLPNNATAEEITSLVEVSPLQIENQGEIYDFSELSVCLEKNNPEILKAQEEYFQAMLDVKDAKALFHPNVDLSLGGAYYVNPAIGEFRSEAGALGDLPITNPETGQVMMQPLPASDLILFEGMPNALYSFQFDIQQPIFTWGKLTNGVKIFSAVADVKALQLSSTKKQQSFHLEGNLATLYYLLQMEKLLEEQNNYATRLVQLSKEAEKNGMLLKQDVLEAEMQAALVPVSMANLQANKSNILQNLQRMTGLSDLLPENIAFVPDDEYFENFAKIEFSVFKDSALAPEREAISIVDKLYEIAEITHTVAKDSIYWKPDIALQISFGLQGNMEKLFKGERDLKNDLVADFTLGIKTTVWDGGKKLNQINRALSEKQIAQIEGVDAKSAIIQELTVQYNALQMALLKIQYQQLKISTADSDIERKEKLVQSGYGSEREVLTAKISKITEQITLLQERINLALATNTIRGLTEL